MANSFTSGSSLLQTNATLLDQTFAAGGAQITSSARAGAQAIESAGLGIAPALQGAIAAGGEQAATIRNALSSPISVNVSAQGGKSDTGAAVPN